MNQKRQQAPERFAAAADILLHGGRVEPVARIGIESELALAERLHAGAALGIPDPAFVDGLRQELRLHFHAAAARPAAEQVHYATMETPLGCLALAYREGLVVYCAAMDQNHTAAGEGANGAHASAGLVTFERAVAGALGAWPERDQTPPPAVERAVREHLAGRRRFTHVDLSWLKPFQRRVLEKTAEIPRGEVRPYGWIAREIGAPGATRAVGTALGHNPIPFLIPCHRVVRSDGSLGEYSGGGPAVKERVLALEGAPVAELLSGPRYLGSSTTHAVCYPSCHAARRIRPEYAVPFASLARARAGGYRPCELCRPA